MRRFPWLRRIRWPGGLSQRLLLLVAAFTLIAEIMILLPSLAAYQEALAAGA